MPDFTQLHIDYYQLTKNKTTQSTHKNQPLKIYRARHSPVKEWKRLEKDNETDHDAGVNVRETNRFVLRTRPGGKWTWAERPIRALYCSSKSNNER